ncbi:DUF5777 family beta-barrel protein [Bacteroidota bacterium]
MKKLYIVIAILFLSTGSMFAQLNDLLKIEDKPVRTPFDAGMVIDNQTVYMPVAKTLDFNIGHRFDEIKEISNLYGIYGSSNIRMGLNYTVTDWLQIGIGTTKFRKLQDIGLKLNLLEQTRENKIPVAVSFYGNMGIDARSEAYFGKDYKFTNRLSYFSQLIIARKFTDWLTVQVAPSFSHINRVDSVMEHDKIGISFAFRIKVSPQSAIVFNYDLPLHIEGIQEHTTLTNKPLPNFGIGWEIATSTHAFQIFIATSTALSPQYTMMENQNDWTDGQIFFGFYINRLWSF